MDFSNASSSSDVVRFQVKQFKSGGLLTRVRSAIFLLPVAAARELHLGLLFHETCIRQPISPNRTGRIRPLTSG